MIPSVVASEAWRSRSEFSSSSLRWLTKHAIFLNYIVQKLFLQNHFDGFKHHGESVEILIENDIIVDIKTAGERKFPTEYWMPQFVNAHCHLELTNLFGKMPKRNNSQRGDSGKLEFFDWLAELRRQVADWTKDDYRASYLVGLGLAKKAGTAIIYDVGNQMAEPPNSVFHYGANGNPYLFAMHEVIKQELPPPCAPHSIYATPPELVRNAILSCIDSGIPWSIHLAEFDERDAFEDFLKIFDCEGEFTKNCLKNGFIIHGNFLKESDLTYMSKNNIALAHCPQSHEWFGHKDPDFDMWKGSGVDLCIATDSLASADSLSLLEQLRTLFRRYPNALSPEAAFACVTSTPAKYLNPLKAASRSSLLQGQVHNGVGGDFGGQVCDYGKIAVGCSARLQKFSLPDGIRSEDALLRLLQTASG